MASSRMKRVAKELSDISNDTISGISIQTPSTDDLTNLTASFTGPSDTPYAGGTYNISIKIPSEYPFKPPIMKFDTKLWHPNVSSQTGAICLDTLGTAWSPVLNIKSALLSLQSLLNSPEPNDPQDAVVAKQLKTDPAKFAATAREWAIKYAGAPRGIDLYTGYEEGKKEVKTREQLEAEETARYKGFHKGMIKRFADMGFEVEDVVAAFQHVGAAPNDGREYDIPPGYAGDIMSRLLGE